MKLIGSFGAAVFGAGRRTSKAQVQPELLPGKIAFVREGSIWTWSAGQASRLLDADNISDPRWSPDGVSLIYTRTGNSFSDLYTYSSSTKVETRLTDNVPEFDIGSVEYAALSSWALDPDWARTGIIGFVSDLAGQDAYLGLWLMSSVTETPYYALEPGIEEDISGLCLSSDGSFATYTVRVRLDNGQLGTYVAARDLNNGFAYPVAQSSGDIFDSAISPNGQWIAMTIRSDDGVTDLWVVERATEERKRLTKDENAMAPRWSDDGDWFAYMRVSDYQFEIWVASFSNGMITGSTKIYDEDGVDPQSGLDWFTPREIEQ